MQERPLKIVGGYHMPGFIEFCNGKIYSWMLYKSNLGALSCMDDMNIYLLLTERWEYAPTINPLNVCIYIYIKLLTGNQGSILDDPSFWGFSLGLFDITSAIRDYFMVEKKKKTPGEHQH